MIRNVRQIGEILDDCNAAKLKILAEHYAATKNYFGSRYSGPKSLILLKKHRQMIRDVLMQTEIPKQFKLSARYWKLALDESVSGIKSEWSNTKNRVKKAASQNPNLSKDEKHYINFVLRWNDILSAILCRQLFIRPDKMPDIGNRTDVVHQLIRRYVRKHKGKAPIAKRKVSFMIDSAMYQYQTIDGILYLEIAGTAKNKRIRIKIHDHNRHTGNLRIVLSGNRVVINTTTPVKAIRMHPENRVLGIDKGYTSLFATSNNTEYGVKLGSLLTIETERLNSKNRIRNQIWAQINTLTKNGQIAKAECIRKNNFGTIKKDRQKHRFEEKTKSYINHTIHDLLKNERPDVIITEKLTFTYWQKKLPKQVKRKLTRWMKGYIQERLEFISGSQGIHVVLVNPAYTSQICHQCGAFGKRAGKSFVCPTHGKIDADINAAHNIKCRHFDRHIKLITPYQKVKLILTKRQSIISAG